VAFGDRALFTKRMIKQIEASASPSSTESSTPAPSAGDDQLRIFADAVPQIIWTNDADGFANYFNKRWYDYSGLTFEQSAGGGWQNIVHPADEPASRERWHRALSRGEVFDTEYRLRGADGVYRWFLGRNVPFKDASGRVQQWFGTATEIEDLKRAQQQAHESEARLRVTLESAIDHAIVGLDVRGVVVTWSTGAERIFGYRADEAIGQPGAIIFTDADREAGLPEVEMRKALTFGRAEDERWHVRRDGSLVYMSGVMAPIYDDSVLGFVKVARDMTERQQAEEALKESEARYRELAADLSRTKEALLAADRQKDQFIATLAHELRNPLAPVRSAMQIISMSGSQDPAVLWSLDVVKRQTQIMARLIDDLMDVSRISRNKLVLRAERIDLTAVLRDSIDVSRTFMAQRGHILTVDLPTDPIFLNGDSTRLAQLFTNLLDNAVKYTEPGGQIFLSANVEAGEAVVHVRDTGIGIAPEHQAEIFGLFSQVRSADDRASGGLGIGLALSRQLAEMHGGSISVNSAGEGTGSEFVVRLPLVTDVELMDAKSYDHLPVLSLAGVRILVVDDNIDAADSIDTLLTQHGATVRSAYDGASALTIADELKPDIVLLDIGLPRLTGHEVASQLRARTWGPSAILIAISGWGTEEEKRKSYEAGFDRHMVKPVEPMRLLRVMSELLIERDGSSIGERNTSSVR
jgi:PAS domain S-box-containing protein